MTLRTCVHVAKPVFGVFREFQVTRPTSAILVGAFRFLIDSASTMCMLCFLGH